MMKNASHFLLFECSFLKRNDLTWLVAIIYLTKLTLAQKLSINYDQTLNTLYTVLELHDTAVLCVELDLSVLYALYRLSRHAITSHMYDDYF